MASETMLFQKDPFSYGSNNDYLDMMALADYYNADQEPLDKIMQQGSNGCFQQTPPPLMAHSLNSSPEIFCPGGDLIIGGYPNMAVSPVNEPPHQRKRRRTKRLKNKEEIETQRMTHIAVERNRRQQMNHYLALLRSLMPPSFAQRGDQASIVGGAIDFVKELEQLLQFLESHKQVKKHQALDCNCHTHVFNDFFIFPQYSTCMFRTNNNGMGEQKSTIADVEVTLVESQANIKVFSSKRPKQLVKLVIAFHSISLTILHLNITTVENMVLYSFSVKVEDDCQLTTVNEIATAVHEILGMIQEEAMVF